MMLVPFPEPSGISNPQCIKLNVYIKYGTRPGKLGKIVSSSPENFWFGRNFSLILDKKYIRNGCNCGLVEGDFA